MNTVYGLKNCDSCRKARNWLSRHGIDHQFVDVREQLPTPGMFEAWQQAVGGWDKLINRASTTWRQLADNRKSPGSDAEWKLLLREYPALIKRPLLQREDGSVTQGFSDKAWAALFGIA